MKKHKCNYAIVPFKPTLKNFELSESDVEKYKSQLDNYEKAKSQVKEKNSIIYYYNNELKSRAEKNAWIATGVNLLIFILLGLIGKYNSIGDSDSFLFFVLLVF